jgi:uncharacterized membrane protein SpoIIM required for sporulation
MIRAKRAGHGGRSQHTRAALGGTIAGAVGLAIAWGVNEAMLRASASAHPEVIMANHAALPWIVVVAVLLLGAALGGAFASPLVVREQGSGAGPPDGAPDAA